MSYTVMHCPVWGCEWSYRVPSTATPFVLEGVAHAHMDSHDVRDFLETIAKQEAQIQLLKELTHDTEGGPDVG